MQRLQEGAVAAFFMIFDVTFCKGTPIAVQSVR
jgi:hypothetical protein